MPDREDVRRRYRQLREEELRRCVDEMADLVPDVLPVLRDELARRGLEDLARAVDLQRRGLAPEECSELVRWLSSRPCPTCGARDEPLDVCSLRTMSEEEVVLGCPSCLEAAVRRASLENAGGCLFGGALSAFGSARAQSRNAAQLAAVRAGGLSPALRAYVERHQGMLAVARERASALAAPDEPDP